MKGRPGDAHDHQLRRRVGDHSAGGRRAGARRAAALKHARAKVTLSAGARQVVRMTLARPLADDPVLLGRQREMAALKVVGSGVDASAVGTGKTISSGRALAHRATHAAPFPRARRRRGTAARPVARGAHARRAWPRTATAGAQRRVARALRRSADRRADPSLRPRARRPARRRARRQTACSTATRPTCRRSRGIC